MICRLCGSTRILAVVAGKARDFCLNCHHREIGLAINETQQQQKGGF